MRFDEKLPSKKYGEIVNILFWMEGWKYPKVGKYYHYLDIPLTRRIYEVKTDGSERAVQKTPLKWEKYQAPKDN